MRNQQRVLKWVIMENVVMKTLRRGEERRGEEGRGEEDTGTLGPRVENKSKVNMKDETGAKERAEFRSEPRVREGKSETGGVGWRD